MLYEKLKNLVHLIMEDFSESSETHAEKQEKTNELLKFGLEGLKNTPSPYTKEQQMNSPDFVSKLIDKLQELRKSKKKEEEMEIKPITQEEIANEMKATKYRYENGLDKKSLYNLKMQAFQMMRDHFKDYTNSEMANIINTLKKI